MRLHQVHLPTGNVTGRKPKLKSNNIINLQVSVPVRTYKYGIELLLLFLELEYRQTFIKTRTSRQKAHVS